MELKPYYFWDPSYICNTGYYSQCSHILTGKQWSPEGVLTLTDQHRASRTVSESLQLGVSPCVKTAKFYALLSPEKEDMHDAQVRTKGVL